MSHFVQNGTSRTPSPTVDCKMEMKSVLRKDAVPYGCFFGHGYKEGSVWNRPLQYFSQPWDVGNVIPDGCLFERGYKEGSVWNRPLQYFPQQRDVGNAVPYKIPSPDGRGLG